MIIKSKNQNTTFSQHSFRALFYELYPRLLSNCLKFVKDEFAAEEIVEDAMLALWDRRDKIVDIKDVKSYLYVVVRNKALAYLRQNKKEIPLDISGIEIEDHEGYDAYIIEEELHTMLFNALKELPDRCRDVFLLSCIYQMPYKEISKELGISVNTVKSQRTRAIELLKMKLKKLYTILFLIEYPPEILRKK
ncbi:RNA polymerase sigma-70 factor [Sinomicrobium sp.]